MAPQDVTWENEEAVWKRLYDRRLKGKRPKPKFKVGDRMLLNKIHRTFEKGYVPGWTKEVFVVHRVVPGPVPTYKIREWMTRSSKARFTTPIYKKCTCSTKPCFGSKRYLSVKKISGWSSGKGGRTSTIVGLPEET